MLKTLDDSAMRLDAITWGSASQAPLRFTKAGSATATGLKSTASDMAGSVASLVPEISVPDTDKAFEAVSDAGATVGNGISSAAAAGRVYGVAIQSRLSKGLEKQPLLLGAIGLAIRVPGAIWQGAVSATVEALHGRGETSAPPRKP